jgi:hypothetical protein
LPKLREELLNYREKNILFKNRLNQMNNYLTLRMQEAERMGIIEFLEKYKANRFLKIKSIHDYLLNLWQMTDDSLVSVTELVNTLYQENTQKEINTLQAIFMISVTASFLTLGAMPGAVLKFFDIKNNLLASGTFTSFNLPTLIQFGLVALVFSFAIYFAWDLIFKNFRKLKITSIIRFKK